MPNEYELMPKYDARKSFYGKARVRVDDDGNRFLISYGTPVMWWDAKTKTLHRLDTYYGWSSTTGRHVKEFSLQCGCKAVTKKEWDRMAPEPAPHAL
jgi:hypothetical protein